MNAINNITATLTTTPAPTRAINPSVPSDKVYLDAAGVKLAKEAFSAEGAAEKKWIRFADYARSQGVTYSMVISGGEARKWIEENIVIPYGLTPEQRAAVMAPKSALKGWTEDQKRFRRVNCQQAIGSKLGRIAGYLMTEEEKFKTETKEEKPEKKMAPLADMLKKELSAMLVRIQKSEDLEGLDPSKLCKALSAVIALIN